MWMGFDEYEQTMRELLNEKDALREKSSARDYKRSKRALNRAFAFVMAAERVLSPDTVEEIWKSAKEWYPEHFQSSDWASIKAIKEKDALQEDEQTGSAGQALALDLAEQ